MKGPRSVYYVERLGAQLHLSYSADRFDKLSYGGRKTDDKLATSLPPFEARGFFKDEKRLPW